MPIRKVASQDANSRIPESTTQSFIDGILNLPQDRRTRYLQEQFLTKFVSSETDPPEHRRTRAINKWLATEMNNEATNDRLLTTPEDYQILPRVPWCDFVSFAQGLVAKILGEVPPDDVLLGTFSGGASTSRNRASSHPAEKYLGKADITIAALPLFDGLLSAVPGWSALNDFDVRVVPGNVLFTVPKKTDIDRCACKEPDLNMLMQKGCGLYIRRALKRWKIDLNDQSVNRDLARVGSETRDLATLDLSSASDSVSTELVALLLPPLWYSLLNALRSPVTIIDGAEHRNEMFSSMGNGFTFELESLLFFVLARTTAYFRGVSGIVSVYGDDIICPTPLAEDLIFVLRFMGFETNESKSHWTGDFRESCGGHYINGFDVTPFYLRAPLERLTDVIHMANSLRKWSDDYSIGILDPECWALWAQLRDLVPRGLWGGRDCSFKYALVTPDSPRGFLHEKKKTVSPHTGCYIHWLGTTWDRDLPGETVTSIRSSGLSSFRMRPNRVVNTIIPLFLEELDEPCVQVA